MSSEAAYFPNALAIAADLRELEAAASRVSEQRDEAVEQIDELLLARVAAGDKSALSELFRAYARPVRNVACRILRNEAEADEVVQEVFLAIFRKAALFDPAQGRASSWILHMAYHKALDRRRHLVSRGFYAAEDIESIDREGVGRSREAASPENSLEGTFGAALLDEFRAKLTPEQQETLHLFFFEGYSLREIAAKTGRPLANVRSHYYRGLERLRRIVAARGIEPR